MTLKQAPRPHHRINAHVDVSEMMGSEVHLHVVAGEKDVVLHPPTDLPAQHRAGIPSAPRSTSPSPRTWSIFFDPSTELNLLALR